MSSHVSRVLDNVDINDWYNDDSYRNFHNGINNDCNFNHHLLSWDVRRDPRVCLLRQPNSHSRLRVNIILRRPCEGRLPDHVRHLLNDDNDRHSGDAMSSNSSKHFFRHLLLLDACPVR